MYDAYINMYDVIRTHASYVLLHTNKFSFKIKYIKEGMKG